MDRTQKIALGFAVVLALVTALGFIPGLTDAEGRTFGIRNGILDWPLSFKILASAPHLILGGVAMFSGFVLGRD